MWHLLYYDHSLCLWVSISSCIIVFWCFSSLIVLETWYFSCLSTTVSTNKYYIYIVFLPPERQWKHDLLTIFPWLERWPMFSAETWEYKWKHDVSRAPDIHIIVLKEGLYVCFSAQNPHSKYDNLSSVIVVSYSALCKDACYYVDIHASL